MTPELAALVAALATLAAEARDMIRDYNRAMDPLTRVERALDGAEEAARRRRQAQADFEAEVRADEEERAALERERAGHDTERRKP